MAGVPMVLRDRVEAPRARGALPPRDLQELWFATRRRPWTSLCVVPAAPGMSVVPIARALAEVGQLVSRDPVRVIDAEGMDLAQIADIVLEMSTAGSSVWTSIPRQGRRDVPSAARDGTPLVLAIDSVVENPLVLPIPLAADVVLLCAELGASDLAAARHTVELIGRDRIVGIVLVKRR